MTLSELSPHIPGKGWKSVPRALNMKQPSSISIRDKSSFIPLQQQHGPAWIAAFAPAGQGQGQGQAGLLSAGSGQPVSSHTAALPWNWETVTIRTAQLIRRSCSV